MQEIGNQPKLRVEALDVGGPLTACIEWIGNIVGIQSRRVRVDVSFGSLLMRSLGKSRKTVEVPVAFLPELRSGDLWRGGVFQASELRQTELFPDLLVDESTTTLIAVGAKIEGTDPPRYALPFKQFNACSGHTRAFLVRLAIAPNSYLVVPSMELIRFYFCRSGVLSKLMFSAGYDFDTLRRSCRLKDGIANVVLPEKLRKEDAPVIARIAFDDAAGHAYRQFLNSYRMASLNEVDWYPKMDFPIKGRTDLQARGVWIEQDGERTFVVSELLSCSHPFPFQTVYVHRKEASQSTNAPIVGKAEPRLRPRDEPLDLTAQRTGKGARIPVRLEREGQTLPPFPDLVGKEVKRGNDRPLYLKAPDLSEVASASLGGVHGREVAEADLIGSEPIPISGLPQVLGYQLELLHSLGWSPVLFKNGRPVHRVSTDAVPTTAIPNYHVWIAVLTQAENGGVEAQALGLACLDMPLAEDLPELAMARLAPGDVAQMASDLLSCLRSSVWGRTTPTDEMPGTIHTVLSSREIIDAVNQGRIERLLCDPVVGGELTN